MRTALIAPLILAAALLSAADADLTTPEAVALRTDHLARQEALSQTRLTQLAAMLDRELATVRERQARARVSGNTSALASAKFAVKLFEEAQASLKAEKSFVLPEKVRRELEERIDACRREQQAIEDVFTAAVRQLEGESDTRLRALLEAQQVEIADEEHRQLLLRQLLGQDPAATTEEAVDPVETNAVPVASGQVLPDVLGANGEAEAWKPLLKLTFEVNAMEMLAVPLTGIAAPRTLSGEGLVSGQPYRVELQPFRELVGGAALPTCRLRSVPGTFGVDVVAWPSARNDGKLELRVRPGRGTPSHHACLVEIDAASPALKAIPGVDGGEGASRSGDPDTGPEAGDMPRVRVNLSSDPAGAFVSVNGRLLALGGQALRTPFGFELPATPLEIRFRQEGFLDVIYKDATPKADSVLHARLHRDPDYVEEVITVPAGGKGWQTTRIRVKTGQRVRLSATGKWSCGPGREAVDARGYPNDATFFKYYLDPTQYPRQLNGANYGALLVRVAPDGPSEALGNERTFQPTVDGTLSFDINEGAAARHDNSGVLKVRILVAPGRP